jgi:eukaryotic-like serine/threonine-protein kinase
VSEAAVATAPTAAAPLVVGRYALFDELAAGGMATVHLGRLLGPVGFGRTVAVKRLHSHYLKDQEFITMFMDEARIVARIRHPNVVPMVDVVQCNEGLFLVMEYIHGESLSRLMRTARSTKEKIPPRIVAAVMSGVLLGLHAAHETKGSDGKLINVVHRDVSPQNVMVGSDGSARVLDFGIAKAAGRAQVTREGQIKGKLAYMAPEQIRGQVDRRTDVFAASVVLWEMLAGRRLHEGAKDVDIVTKVVQGNFPRPSQFTPELTPEIDDIVLKGLASDPKKRYSSAREIAVDLEKRVGLATPTEVTEWVERLAKDVLEARSNLVAAMEAVANDLVPPESKPPPPLAMPRTMPLAIPTPALGIIPVDYDHANGNGNTSTSTNTNTGDVPSSSAVFSNTRVATEAENAIGQPRRIHSAAWIVVALSAALAVIGASLGAYAIYRRATAVVAPAGSDPSAMPSGIPSIPDNNAPLGVTGTRPSASPPTTVPPASPTHAPPPPVDLDEPPAAPPHSAPIATNPPTPSVTVAATPTAKAPPFVTQQPIIPAVKPKPKNCEPPYTVDDLGHRHYKPECMGL